MSGYRFYSYGSAVNVIAFAKECAGYLPEMKITCDKYSTLWFICETPGKATYAVDKKFNGKIKIRLKGGQLQGTVGTLAGIHFTQIAHTYGHKNQYIGHDYTFKLYIKIILPNGTEKIIKRVPDGLSFPDLDIPICYKKNERKKDAQVAMAKRVRTNKFDQTIKMGAIVLVFNKNMMMLEYAKVDKIHKSYIEYISVTALGKRQGKKVWRCYDHQNLMYVPDNTEDIEAALAMDFLTL